MEGPIIFFALEAMWVGRAGGTLLFVTNKKDIIIF
jgi:hypothetical protein